MMCLIQNKHTHLHTHTLQSEEKTKLNGLQCFSRTTFWTDSVKFGTWMKIFPSTVCTQCAADVSHRNMRNHRISSAVYDLSEMLPFRAINYSLKPVMALLRGISLLSLYKKLKLAAYQNAFISLISRNVKIKFSVFSRKLR